VPHGRDEGRHVTVSIGAATAIAASDAEPSRLVATADAALYRAKHMGRNRISLPVTELMS
jgi:diguanylate cyclase (GGDEF)-like protein